MELAQSAIWRRQTQLDDVEFIELANCLWVVLFTNAGRDNACLQNELTRTYLNNDHEDSVANSFQSIYKAYMTLSLSVVCQDVKLALSQLQEKMWENWCEIHIRYPNTKVCDWHDFLPNSVSEFGSRQESYMIDAITISHQYIMKGRLLKHAAV
jgi:hypothetical protein